MTIKLFFELESAVKWNSFALIYDAWNVPVIEVTFNFLRVVPHPVPPLDKQENPLFTIFASLA